MKLRIALMGLAMLAAGAISLSARAHAPSGAIFTTVADGSEVNFNIYANKEDVYLDGGPGPGAPQGAAGLDDGTYVFQVTNPNGRTLLSQDIAACRRFTVTGGIITGLVTAGCAAPHSTGTDIDHNATTVQLMPYADTPNPGGVYKVWVVEVNDFLAGCAALGVANGLNVVDCGRAAGNMHGFIPSHSKTDNFKVKEPKGVREIDTRFFPDLNNNGDKDANEPWIDGLSVTWTDTLGASNKKTSYLNFAINVNHEAHVEAPEDGVHTITIGNQTGCTVGTIHVDGAHLATRGPQSVTVEVKPSDKDKTWFIDVACVP